MGLPAKGHQGYCTTSDSRMQPMQIWAFKMTEQVKQAGAELCQSDGNIVFQRDFILGYYKEGNI